MDVASDVARDEDKEHRAGKSRGIGRRVRDAVALFNPGRAAPGASLLALACLLLPPGILFVKIAEDRTAVIAEAERNSQNTLNIFEQHAHDTFAGYQLVATMLDWRFRDLDLTEPGAAERTRAFLAGLVADDPRIRVISVLDRDGQLRISNLPRDIQAPNSQPPSFAQTAVKDAARATATGKRMWSWQSDGDILDIATPLTTNDGSFDGVVVITASPPSFARFWERGAPDEATSIYRDDGRLLARYPRPAGDLSAIRAPAEILRLAGAADRGIFRGDAAGTERLISFRQMSGFPLFIVSDAAMSDVLRDWRSNALRESALVGPATLVLFLLALNVMRASRRKQDAFDALSLHTAEITKARGQLAEVLNDTVQRQEDERKHLARELHDRLAQYAAVLHFDIDIIQNRVDMPAAVRQSVARLKAAATEVSREISRLSWQLRPAGLDELGIETAIRCYAESISGLYGFTIDLHLSSAPFRLKPAIEVTLYRFVQEAITNVIKHANASVVSIVFEVSAEWARLMVEDNGRGFTSAATFDETSGDGRPGRKPLGLLGIRERLSLIGGKMEIEAAIGSGTALYVEVPV